MNEDTAGAGDGLEYSSDGGSHRVEFDANDQQVSMAVVRAVAAIDGRAPNDLDPLYHVVDPDALDTLFGPTIGDDHRGDVEISFRYHGYEVSVRSYGMIVISETDVPAVEEP